MIQVGRKHITNLQNGSNKEMTDETMVHKTILAFGMGQAKETASEFKKSCTKGLWPKTQKD